MSTTQPLVSRVALETLRRVNFAAVTRVNSVWDNDLPCVSRLHHEIREWIHGATVDLVRSPESHPDNPHIKVYTGAAGAGKTHLLAQTRRSTIESGGQFILVDMTGIRQFWPTLLLNFVQSLREDGPDGGNQIQHMLAYLFQQVNGLPSLASARDALSAATPEQMPVEFEKINAWLRRFYGLRYTASHAEALRALVLYTLPDPEVSDAAYTWLQGAELETRQAHELKLGARTGAPEIVSALAWLLSLRGPTIVAFDQLDSIVIQHELASRGDSDSPQAQAALAVIHEITGGLAAIWEKLQRTQIVVSCLDQTWRQLEGHMLTSVRDRFELLPKTLAEISSAELARDLVAQRLEAACLQTGFSPPYPTYPFASGFFISGLRPRQLMQSCHEHKTACLRDGRVTELDRFTTADPSGQQSAAPDLTPRFERLRSECDPQVFLEDDEQLGRLTDVVCSLLVRESPPPKQIEATVDLDPGHSTKQPGLHTRLSLAFLEEGDREEHFCFRALQHPNPVSFQARLRAAMTDSGVDRNLPFRRLFIVRTRDVPSGAKTAQMVETLKARGGSLLAISHDEIRSLHGLDRLSAERHPLFDGWLQKTRPLRQLDFVRQAFGDYFLLIPSVCGPGPCRPEARVSTDAAALPAVPSLLLGKRQGPARSAEWVWLPLAALSRHVAIRAGTGGGKTVLLKRLVENAALLGTPSIVIDPGNDLAYLGDPWPQAHPHWLPGDAERANELFEKTEVLVWTPGRNAARPLFFAPLPDFGPVVNDADELEAAVAMAAGSLVEATGAGKGAGATVKQGLLKEALRYFARGGGGTLDDFAAFLAELPIEAHGNIRGAAKRSSEMADSLRGALLRDNRLLSPSQSDDPAALLGIGRQKTRISVINLMALDEHSGEKAQFVNMLAMSLFSWIRKNPPAEASKMTGLLVLDEAKDFLPGIRTTPCKESLMRLAAQARKYGLGLLFATQNPMDIDHRAIGQFSTQFFGRASSPRAIASIRDAIDERGGHAADLTRLEHGEFYVCSPEGIRAPLKIRVPMCLTHHPDGRTPTEKEILERALKPEGKAVGAC